MKYEYTYPCKICLVVACCSRYCTEYFKFINRIADEIPLMTADQIKEYRDSTPIYVKHKVEEFAREHTRYAFADTWESNIPRYERASKGNKIHVRP